MSETTQDRADQNVCAYCEKYKCECEPRVRCGRCGSRLTHHGQYCVECKS